MKAIVHDRYGRPEVLEQRDAELPEIEDDQVLVRVHASSVNPVEWYGVTGFLSPHVSAVDCAARRTCVSEPTWPDASKRSAMASRGCARATRCSGRAPAHGPSTR